MRNRKYASLARDSVKKRVRNKKDASFEKEYEK